MPLPSSVSLCLSSRWQPYIGLGARAAHFDLRFDGRMTQRHATEFDDPLAKCSIGLGWRF